MASQMDIPPHIVVINVWSALLVPQHVTIACQQPPILIAMPLATYGFQTELHAELHTDTPTKTHTKHPMCRGGSPFLLRAIFPERDIIPSTQ